jgi:Lrp/AsnC family transcriptional regulator, leucine-responsive regulatory protein
MEPNTGDLDATDRRILKVLQAEGDIPNNQLAERVGITPGPCSRRVARLHELGIIRKHTVVLDHKALGFGIVAFVEVTLDRHASNLGPAFVDRVKDIPEVVECHIAAGTYDFLLKIVARDMQDYQRLVWDAFNQIEGVRTVRSVFVLDTVKEGTAPLE